jgi:hypothetical protein
VDLTPYLVLLEAAPTPSPDGWSGLFTGLGLGRITLSGVGGLAIIGLLTGRIITLREHRETRADRDVWRDSSLGKDAIIATLTHQLEIESRGSQLGLKVVETIDEVVEKKAKGQPS